MYQVLLFDADNTLFDFDACEQQALIAAFQQYHIDLTAPILSCFHAINADLWGNMNAASSLVRRSSIPAFKSCFHVLASRRTACALNIRINQSSRKDTS